MFIYFITERAFWGRTQLHTLELSASVEALDRDAFYHCKALETIRIPKEESRLREIGIIAFAFCDALKELDLSSLTGVTTLEMHLFGMQDS